MVEYPSTQDYPAESTCKALLRNGSSVDLRAIRPSDAVALEAFHEQLSEQTIYRRFFSFHPHLRASEIEHFTRVDFADRFALVAESGGDIVGVARYDRIPDTQEAEVAFVIADQLQGLGLGTLLLEHLAAAAHRRGIAEFIAETLASNSEMQEVFARTGFTQVRRVSLGVVDVRFRIDPSERYLEAVLQREWAAQHAWAMTTFSSLGRGRLGVACRSTQLGNLLLTELSRSGIDVSMLLVTDELGISQTQALAILAADPGTDVVALQLEALSRPRTFLASARTIARAKPIVAMGVPGEIAAQAGISLTTSISALAMAAGDALAATKDLSWRGPETGTLPTPDGLDVGAAHSVLSAARTGQVAEVVALLGCYGVLVDTVVGDWPNEGVHLALSDRDGLALRTNGKVQTGPWLLPLTDVDLQSIMQDSTVPTSDVAGIIDVALRLSRLIADHPQVRSVEAWVVAGGSQPRVRASVWVGPPRGFGDDPFVRRLATGDSPTVQHSGAVGRGPVQTNRAG